MNLQKILYASIFLLTHLNKTCPREEENPDLIISQSGMDGATPCGIGLKFFIELNNTSDKYDYEVQVSADQCCLEADGSLDCDVLEMLGDCVGFIPKGAIKTVRMIAPILDPIERRGYCILYLDSKCSYNGRNKRDTIKVSFDTRTENINKFLQANVKPCRNIDEDPLNDCKPVDCDTYYNTRKPHYNKKIKRCVAAPLCLTEMVSELPNAIYDPVSNQCVEGKSINKRDIKYLKEVNAQARPVKDILIIKKINENTDDNETSHDLNDAIDKVPMCKTCKKLHILNPVQDSKQKDMTVSKEHNMSFPLNYFTSNKYILIVFGGIIFFQCCLIIAMAYYLSRSCTRCKDKKLVRNFFNYRQDASVTTPLIGTSNMDTETDYRFESESSNVDNKIKCYKACQKETINNVKKSMSDDILSKCVNRRNWSRQRNQTEIIQETHNEIQINTDNIEENNKNQGTTEFKKPSETKVAFKGEELKFCDQISTKVKNIPKCLNKEIIDREKEVAEEDVSSELEIQCHSYNNNINYCNVNSNITGFRPSTKQKLGYCNAEKTNAVSMLTDKEAQACFSNDTIDDYLSERGIYLAENISKYTFPSDSDPIKISTTPVSNKSSKNNIVRNILSLLQKKSRTITSDPGSNQKDNLDVKLIHMSTGSICSTSNDSECMKCRQKDSRTSL